MINPFFKNKGPFKIERLLKSLNLDNKQNFNNYKILDIKKWCFEESYAQFNYCLNNKQCFLAVLHG